MYREHPLRIIRYSIKNIWLLIFPLLRSIYSIHASPDTIWRWVRGAWFDILILLLILVFGWLEWYNRQFTVRDGMLYVRDGILFRRQRIMPTCNISALTLEYPFWLRAVGGMYACADTAAGIMGATDIRLMLRTRDGEIFRGALPILRHGKRHGYRQKVRPWRIILFSVIFSSSFSGSLYMAAFWFQGGRISRDLIEELHLRERLSLVSEEVAAHLSGIPPAAVMVGIVILFTWLLSFLNNLMRYGGFYLESDRRLLSVSSGILTKRNFFLCGQKINFLDIRQNLLTKLFRIFTISVNCPGYGNQRGSIPVCLPLLTKREMNVLLPLLFPKAGLKKNTLRPSKLSWWGYVWKPVILGMLLLPAATVLIRLFPALREVLRFFQVMLLIPVVWKLIVQTAALLTSGVALSQGQICLRYCRRLTFHTVIADTDCIAKVKIHRHIWQRWNGKCHLKVYFRSEVSSPCVLWNMDYEKVCELFKNLFS